MRLNLQNNTNKAVLYFLVLVSIIFTLSSCQEKQMAQDPTNAYAVVKSYYDNKDYEVALQKLEEFKARFPYSSFAIQAELLIAESEYKLSRYEEAAVSYSNFSKFHPNHSEVPYTLYMVGICYWKLSPSAIDREQSYTQKAISAWEDLQELYSDSKYAKDSIPLLDKANLKIMKNLEFITKFYYNKKNYSACAYRSLELIEKAKNFPDIISQAVPRAIYSFEKVLDDKKKNPDSDKNVYLTMSEDKIEYIINKLKNYDLTFNK